MTALGASGSKTDYFQEANRGDLQQAREPQNTRDAQRPESLTQPRSEHGHFAPLSADKASDVSNMLKHIETLETKLASKDKQLTDAQQRVEKFSARTREGMQSALDSLMKKWMDACETKDEKHKEQFKHGMEKLVQNSAEENGVWQMMVAASALHQRQEHDLNKLRGENVDLKLKIDGHYATKDSRTQDTLGKRKAEGEPDSTEDTSSIWENFAQDCGQY
jgi:hypothetical protein